MSDHHAPLPVELLVPADKRRITIDDHQAFRETLALPIDDDDDLDDLAADPVHDHVPSRRSDRELDRLLGILDGLKSNRKESAQ